MENITNTFNSKDRSYSFFKIERAVENIPTVSILIASLYRNLRMVSASERSSNHNAEELYLKLNSSTDLGSIFTNAELVELFNTSLSIPTSESQLKKKKIWASPIVPEVGNYGLAARMTGNPWNPGGFILEILANYSSNIDEFLVIIKGLVSALEVDDNDNDVWSICVRSEFKSISKNLNIQCADNYDEKYFRDFYLSINRPEKKLLYLSEYARNAIVDIRNIVDLKNRLTRQKWLGFFEAFLRLTVFNHIIYSINLSRNYFNIIADKLLQGSNDISESDLYDLLNLKTTLNDVRIKVGTGRKQYIRDHVESFAYYNALLGGMFSHCGIPNFEDFVTIHHFRESTETLIRKFGNRSSLEEFKMKFQEDNETDLLKLNENFSSFKNIKESLGYLCTRKSSSKEKYISDVNYLFDKIGPSINSPYIFKISSGLISALTSLIFLRLDDSRSFISGLEFIKGLNDYNIQLSINDISTGNIKDTMLSLGIVIDCPDTEGGVLIIKPAWIK